MSISKELAERRFNAGEFVEMSQIARTTSLTSDQVDPVTRLIFAHALALNGASDEALKWASLHGVHSTDTTNRSRAHIVLGLVEEQRGGLDRAFEHFINAVTLANDSKNRETLAWAQLHLLRNALEGKPRAAVSAMLPDVRRATMYAGLPDVTTYLHECVSVFEGQAGRVDEAARHCDIADSLLRRNSNKWLAANNLINRACLALLSCSFREAERLLQEARRFADVNGFTRVTAAADGNIGHAQLMTGQFELARRSFEAAIQSQGTSLFARLAAREGLARLLLAEGALEECRHVLNGIEHDAGASANTRALYPVRWSAITRARLLARLGNPIAASKALTDAADSPSATQDLTFQAAVQLTLAAIGSTTKPRPSEGISSHLLTASELGATLNKELQGQFHWIASSLVADATSLLAGALRDRAERLWMRQGIVAIPLEIGLPQWKADRHSTDAVTEHDVARTAVNRVRAVLDLSHDPDLIGAELVEVLRLLGCDEASVGTHRNNQCARLDLTETDTGPALTCRIPSDPAKAVALADVFRIGRAALELERARREERNRAALWPDSPVEERAGALFVAEEMQTLLATVRRIAPTNVPILITGETGTGKEVLARMVHAYSNRAEKTFLPFNCSATPKDMLDSQLFGHRRGAFTGATEHFQGVIRAAAGGTLFLDEIGETTLEVQPKLLRFLESSEVHPIGEAQPVNVDVRVVVATNVDLEAMLSMGRFREDLFYRLNIVRLHVPPLRERRVEIPALANHYLDKYARENARGDLRLAEETMEYLLLFRWPGNVRQLANEMRRLAALAEPGAVLMPEHLSPEIAASRRTLPPSDRVLAPTEIVVRLDQPMQAAVRHVEMAMVQYALKKCEGRIEDTAALLGLSRKGLYLKRQRFGLDTAIEASRPGAA